MLLKDKISVIIPVYKVEQYLPKCIDSVLAQTYTNLEIILVDDGSPDGCSDICDEYAALDSRITVLHKVNGGTAEARNYGLKLFFGKYIGFVDSDDYIHPLMFQKLHEALMQSKAELSICNFVSVDANGNRLDECISPIKTEVLSGEDILAKKMFEHHSHYWVLPVIKLYSAQLFRSVGFINGRRREDEFILHEILLQCKSVSTIEDVLYFYFQRDGSAMHQNIGYAFLDGTIALLMRAQKMMEVKSLKEYTEKALLKATTDFELHFHYYKNDRSDLTQQRLIEVENLLTTVFNTALKEGLHFKTTHLLYILKIMAKIHFAIVFW